MRAVRHNEGIPWRMGNTRLIVPEYGDPSEATAKSPAPKADVTSRGTTGTAVPCVSRRLRSNGMPRSVPVAV